MELKEGYKQTDGGVIPRDWNVKVVKDAAKLINGRAYKQEELLLDGKYKVLRVGNFFSNNSWYFSNLELPENQYVEYGDLMYAWSASFGPRFWFGEKTIYHYHIWKVEVKKDIDALFLFYFFEFDKQNILKKSQGGTMFHITKSDMETRNIPLPPTKSEQTAIATALSDTDALISSLENLIEKKRNIKQGVMQELLKPKKGWVVKRLGDCLRRPPSYGINSAAVKYSDTLPTYIRITDISNNGKFVCDSKVSVDHPFSNNFKLEDGDIVFARTGASVGKTYLYDYNDGDLVFAGFLIRIQVNSKILNPLYLQNFTTTANYWNWVKIMSMRSGQPGINGHEYAQLEIPVPEEINIQNEIAKTLSDMDTEIIILEKKLLKIKLLKQGMMQELLTGRIRLV